MQKNSRLQYDEDYDAYKAGKYRETAETWLSSSWQGDALQVYSAQNVFGNILHGLLLHYGLLWQLSMVQQHLLGHC